MRHFGMTTAAMMAAMAPGAAWAKVITSSASLNLQTNALYESGDIVLNPGAFNSSLGTLIDTKITFSGEFKPAFGGSGG